MEEPIEKSFAQEMRDTLRKQLTEFELAKKKQQHDARVVADEGAKIWDELKGSLKQHVEEINEELPEAMLSYSENTSGNEFTLRHEVHDRTTSVIFDAASALISYEGNSGSGAFRPRVEGDALDYGWENTTPCGVPKPKRAFRLEDDEPPMTFSTKEMGEIIIRCIVVEPVPEN
jgi:hypothetical protein